MRKILKPSNQFPQKSHNSPLPLRQNLQNQILNNQKLNRNLELLGLLSSETRVQILATLAKQNFLCVTDIADILRLSISATSHQLQVLRKFNLVNGRRKHKAIYYSLNNNLPTLISVFITEVSV